MLKVIRLCGALSFAALIAACGGVSSPSTQTSQDFSDTLAPGGQISKPFSVSKTGEMELTLKSLTPRPVVGYISLGVGQPSGDACAPLLGYFVSQAALGQVYSFPSIVKGSYCVLIADTGAILTTSTAFTVTLSHP